MTTTWHRMTRADWHQTGIDSHDATDCPGDCPGEVVAPDSPRADLRDSWMARERERRNLSADDRQKRLRDLKKELHDIQFRIHSEVSDARLAGTSWAAIGKGLGLTRQAAQQRFGDR